MILISFEDGPCSEVKELCIFISQVECQWPGVRSKCPDTCKFYNGTLCSLSDKTIKTYSNTIQMSKTTPFLFHFDLLYRNNNNDNNDDDDNDDNHTYDNSSSRRYLQAFSLIQSSLLSLLLFLYNRSK